RNNSDPEPWQNRTERPGPADRRGSEGSRKPVGGRGRREDGGGEKPVSTGDETAPVTEEKPLPLVRRADGVSDSGGDSNGSSRSGDRGGAGVLTPPRAKVGAGNSGVKDRSRVGAGAGAGAGAGVGADVVARGCRAGGESDGTGHDRVRPANASPKKLMKMSDTSGISGIKGSIGGDSEEPGHVEGGGGAANGVKVVANGVTHDRGEEHGHSPEAPVKRKKLKSKGPVPGSTPTKKALAGAQGTGIGNPECPERPERLERLERPSLPASASIVDGDRASAASRDEVEEATVEAPGGTTKLSPVAPGRVKKVTKTKVLLKGKPAKDRRAAVTKAEETHADGSGAAGRGINPPPSRAGGYGDTRGVGASSETSWQTSASTPEKVLLPPGAGGTIRVTTEEGV
ncbi:unnamed protein product, partial [Discosporangium mesarthrocarpum]